MIIELLYEGFAAALLPCALVLLVPGLAVALAARQESTPAVLGYGLATSVAAWAFLSGRSERPNPALITLALAAAIFALVMPFFRRVGLISTVGGGFAGFAAAALWVPCPGDQLAQLMAELPARTRSGLPLLACYLVGLLAPLFFFTAVLHLVPSPVLFPIRPFMLVAGATILGLIALTVATGLNDDVTNRLAIWSLE